MTLSMQAGRMQAYEPEDTPSGCNISDDGSSTTSTSSGTPAVNRHLKAPHLRPSPRGPLSMDGLRPTDSFGSQLQDSDFAPGVPLKVWGNCMFDDEDASSSPPLSPSSHTAAAMRHEDRPAAAALRSASTSIKSMGRPAAAAAAAAAATAASSARAESPASPAPAPSTSSSTTASWESRVRQMLACSSGSGATEDALRLAAPTGALVRCRVVRSKGRLGSGYTYQMLLEDGDVPLLAAKRHALGPGATYLIGAGIDAPRRESECMSKLKSNFMGTEFLLSGPSPSPSSSPSSSSSSSEELCIHFRATGLTTSGPRTMTAVLPTAPCASSCSSSSLDGSAGGLSSVMSMAKDRCLPASLEREVAIVCSKPPEFCEATQCHTLAFPGRKVTTSKKNHQLVCLDHRSNRVGSEVLLQLGKLAEESAGGCDTYALDFAYPLNAHTAFAVALANLDDKLCFKV